MRVRATQAGYFNRLIEAGSIFEVPSRLFSSKWMERVETDKPREVPHEESSAVPSTAAADVSLGQVTVKTESSAAPKKRGRPKKSGTED